PLPISPPVSTQKSPTGGSKSKVKNQTLLCHISWDIIIMSSSKSCVIMHDAAADTIKRFQSSSNMNIMMYVEGVHVISNSNLSAKHDYAPAPA
ncbi:hypothetical protein Goari_007959, partial [Gossypium aridum]|nr:hypothetical protein [Gossypium aridum]